MISSRIKKIDITSIELKAKYRPNLDSKVNVRKYSVETYFFIPIELGVNRRNFTNIDFYREYKNYLKIDPPKVLLSEIADSSSEFIKTYQDLVEELDPNNNESIDRLNDNTKILLNIFKKSIKREVIKVKKYNNPQEKIRVALRLVKNLDISLERYRLRYENIKKDFDSSTAINITFNTGNEYISNLKYRFLHEVILHIMNEKNEVYNDIVIKLKQSLENEVNYRKEHKFPLSSTSKKDNEKLIKRWDIIKYFITNKMIIKAKIDKDSRYLEEILYSFAAGIAMVFATAIAFYYNQKFGNFTISFFGVLVLSYMFKDRLKEWFRSFFSSILQKQLLDHHYNLYDDNNHNIGISKDGFEFIPIDSLRKKIHDIRYSQEILDKELINHDEKVMKFTRKISINMRHFVKTFDRTDIRGISDIINFNFSPIIMRMNTTYFPIYSMNYKGNVKIIDAEKTYEINIVQQVRLDNQIHYQHYVVLISKKGIQKLLVIKK